MNDTDPALDSCGCCAAPAEPTPVPLHNAPGLPALVWRAGTQGRFLAAQKLRLAAHPALRALSTREPSDPAIALLDAWSCVLDVLTFHQERFAQENYLRTATERRSVLELARAIGYELRPGVAASTALAFTMESVPGSPASTRLDPGVKVQSVPGQDEKPQIFETIETIEARPAWNALRPRLTEPSIPLYRGQNYIYLDGTATGLQPGDALLFIGDERKNNPGSERWDFRRVASLELFPLPPLAGPSAGYTRVRLDRPLGSFAPPVLPSVAGTEVYALRQRAGVFGGTAVDWKALPDLTKRAYLGLADNVVLTDAHKKEWPNFTVFRRGQASSGADDGVASFAARAATFAAGPTAGDVQRVATAAAERVARRYEAAAKDSVLRAAQGAVAGFAGLAQTATTLLGAWKTGSAGHLAALGTAAAGLVEKLAALVSVQAPPALTTFGGGDLDVGGKFKADFAALSLTQEPGKAVEALQKVLHELARYLKSPLVQLNLGNVDAAKAALSEFFLAASPLKGLSDALADPEAAAALAKARQLATDALTATDAVANAHAAAAAARESHLFVAAAVKAALEGVIPPQSGTTDLDHVTATGYDSADLAVTLVNSQDEAAFAAAVGAYPQFTPLATGLYLANQLTASSQDTAAKSVRDAVHKAIDDLLASAPAGDSSARAFAASAHAPADPVGDGGAYLVDLDQSYPKIVAAGGWIVLSTPDYQEVYRIDSAVEFARAEFGLSAKVTRITLGAGENHDQFDPAVREIVAYAQSERLSFAQRPIDDPVEGGELVLSAAVADLAPGRLLALTGTAADTGLPAAEIAEVRAVSLTSEGLTALTLAAHLSRAYVRDSLFINANVARATHGETKRDELLGSGDGSRPFQSFVLKQKPLTHVSSPLAPGGAAPAIEIRVAGVRWREVPSFYGVGPAERVYTLRRADDGATTVRFGDGRTGARLPTGVNNVTATYRAGLGFEGQVAAGSLSTLLSRPLGAKGVVNPLAAAGAADPEKLADARDNAPLTVLTLDRVVSLRDHEDYARAFAGIGKARADALWDGERQLVHLTVAAADGSPVDPGSSTFKDLRTSLDAARHASRPLFLSPHTPLRFGLSARVATDPDLVRETVLAAVRAALAAAFSFPARAFGQGVAASQLLAVMQGVPGIVAVDLDSLGLVSDAGVYSPQDALTSPNLPARTAYRDAGNVLHGAELLLLAPASVTLSDLPT